MKYRKLGKYGVKISVLGLGSYLNIAHKVDNHTSELLIRTAIQNGVNLIDTAACYGEADRRGLKGQVEEFLGRILNDYRREEQFIMTKLRWDIGPSVNDSGLTVKHLQEGCEGCLKRLRTDHLDVLLCHRPDADTPLEETVIAMGRLMNQGKILYWGVSEWTPEQIKQANQIAKEHGVMPIAITQNRYNLCYRNIESELIPSVVSDGIGIVTYAALANGILTGKYGKDGVIPDNTRAADNSVNSFMIQNYFTKDNLEQAQRYVQIAYDLNITPAQLAVAWCLHNPSVSGVILGATKVTQLEETLKAADIILDDEILEALNQE